MGYDSRPRGVAQPGSAPHWGCGGRKFESCRPDQFRQSETDVMQKFSPADPGCRVRALVPRLSRMLSGLLLGLLLVVVLGSTAGFAVEKHYSGVQLRSDCQSPRGTQRALRCRSYLMGLSDAHTIMGELRGDKLFCPPPGTTYTEERLVFVKWGLDNPQHMHLPAPVVVGRALADIWPCGRLDQENF